MDFVLCLQFVFNQPFELSMLPQSQFCSPILNPSALAILFYSNKHYILWSVFVSTSLHHVTIPAILFMSNSSPKSPSMHSFVPGILFSLRASWVSSYRVCWLSLNTAAPLKVFHAPPVNVFHHEENTIRRHSDAIGVDDISLLMVLLWRGISGSSEAEHLPCSLKHNVSYHTSLTKGSRACPSLNVHLKVL